MKEVKPLTLPHSTPNTTCHNWSSNHIFIGYVSYDGSFDEVDRKEGEGDRRSTRAVIFKFRSKWWGCCNIHPFPRHAVSYVPSLSPHTFHSLSLCTCAFSLRSATLAHSPPLSQPWGQVGTSFIVLFRMYQVSEFIGHNVQMEASIPQSTREGHRTLC